MVTREDGLPPVPTELTPDADRPSDVIGHLVPTSDPTHHRSLAVLAAAAVVAIAWLSMPVGFGLVLGTLLAFTLQPLDGVLRRKLRGRPQLASLICVLIATVGVVGALGGLGTLLIGRGVVMTNRLYVALSPGGALRALIDRPAARLHWSAAEVTTRIQDAALGAAARAAAIAAVVASATMSGLLLLFFVMLSMHFVLVHGPRLALATERILPLPPRHIRALLAEFRKVGRSVLLGTVLTGLTQGLLAGVGYFVCGVPDAAFFGAATAVASLIPAVGTMLVWAPVGVWLIFAGHPAAGIVELVWASIAVIGISDYVIRPRLVGGDHDTPILLTFIGLLGGVEVFGLLGLIVGPLVMSLAIAVLRMFAREAIRWPAGEE